MNFQILLRVLTSILAAVCLAEIFKIIKLSTIMKIVKSIYSILLGVAYLLLAKDDPFFGKALIFIGVAWLILSYLNYALKKKIKAEDE